MKLFNRRSTIGAAAGAAFAAPLGVPPMQPPQAIGSASGLMQYANRFGLVEAAKADPSWEKMEAARKYLRTAQPPRDWSQGEEYNIQALKSVSEQHKFHMRWAAQEKRQKERESWQESILRMFGLSEDHKYRLF